jgi:chromosome segregation ATPase
MENQNRSLERFNVTDAAIAAMREKYMPLTIAGLDDACGLQAVHAARMVVKSHRVQVEKVRKDLKADALEYGRKVDAEAKRITAMLEPIETHLANAEGRIEAEKETIRNAARLKAEAEAKAAADAEAARIKAAEDAERDRIKATQDAENARLKAEADRLAEQQRKIDAERKAIDDEKRRLDAIETALAAIETARLREIENERIRMEAAEKARIETEERIAREAAAAKAKADAREAARLRREARLPDRDKLQSVVAAVRAIAVPEVTNESNAYAKSIQVTINQCADQIAAIIEEMESE